MIDTGAPPCSAQILPEIEGMRALAVLVVLLYHAHFGFSGGYIGVDVFFVVSGFLITSLLKREHEATGRIRLRRFYARRARRLLPAATLVLLTTLLLANRLLSPVRAHQTAVDAAFAGGFVANFHLASVGADYLQATQPPSLLQHWWSLAVEEQFYLVWPGLLAVTWWLGRRIARSGLIVCFAVAATSFAIGLRLTRHNPSWGYFATWSRGWELALGAICAFLWSGRHRMPSRAISGWCGVAAIAYSAIRFNSLTPFPGTAALVPVLGSMLVILSIGDPRSPGRVLSHKPLQWVGGRSYGIYLWHWPLLIILNDRIASPTAAWRAGTLALAIAIAALTYWLIEDPVRHLPALVRSAGASLALGATTVAMVLGAASIASAATTDIHFTTGFTAPAKPTARVAPTPTADTIATAPTTGSVPFGSAGAEAADVTTTIAPTSWGDQLTASIATQLQPLIANSAAQDLLPDNITPSISRQRADHPSIYSDCLLTFSQSTSPPCEFGDVTSATSVAIIGDSHAVQWFPGVEAAALANHWKLVVLTKRACPAATVSVMLGKAAPYPACDQWRARALARIAASDIKLVIITSWRRGYLGNADGSGYSIGDRQWRDALTRSVVPLQAAGKKVLFLADAPMAHQQMDACMSSHPQHMTLCTLVRNRSVDVSERDLERDLASSLGVEYYDTSDWFCAGTVCPAVVGNMAVYLDTNHINNTYGTYLGTYFELLIKQLLGVPVG